MGNCDEGWGSTRRFLTERGAVVSLVFGMRLRRSLAFLLAFVIAPLGNLGAQAPASLSVAPAKPKPGAVVRVAITVDPAGDSIVAVRGTMAGEPLHFAAAARGRYAAIGGVPVDSTSPTMAEAIVERASGRADTLRATVEPPPLPPPSEQLAVLEALARCDHGSALNWLTRSPQR